jgi:hypothetical protein
VSSIVPAEVPRIVSERPAPVKCLPYGLCSARTKIFRFSPYRPAHLLRRMLETSKSHSSISPPFFKQAGDSGATLGGTHPGAGSDDRPGDRFAEQLADMARRLRTVH